MMLGRGNRVRIGGVLVTACALLTGACSGGGSEAKDSPVVVIPPVNFLNEPEKAKAIVDEMVGPETPITGLNISATNISLQEIGREGAFVRFEKVADPAALPGATVPTTTNPDGAGKKKFGAPAAVPPQQYMGRTVFRDQLPPEEAAALDEQLAEVEERKDNTITADSSAPPPDPPEPYVFGADRADSWSYLSSSGLYSRAPMPLDQNSLKDLPSRVFFTSSIDFTAILPLEKQLLAQLDMGDHEQIDSISFSRSTDTPGVTMMINAKGDRGSGSLTVADGQVTIHKS